ncbi:MAG: hypothetical protein KA734_00940 [Fluviicola sp.]|nr:hypothetical protein [Fluviicola sp.]
MTKTTKYQDGVMAVISLVKLINSEIGDYQEHFVNESFIFSVKLTNGAINMSVEVAQDYEAQPSSVTQDRLEKVAKTFRKI